jgi:HAD superfamily hydrolase (TIGR01662 family)
VSKLFLFDLDGTVIRSFLREGAPRTPEEYAKVELLPGRLERLRALEVAHTIAFVTNQGGVAFGYQQREEVIRKLAKVNFVLGDASARIIGRMLTCSGQNGFYPALFYVAFTHPKAQIERYKADDGWRKPGPGMISTAMANFHASPNNTLFVGDMDSDRECAANAGVSYEDAGDFFGTEIST